MKIKSHAGLLYKDRIHKEAILSCYEADKIAQANGHHYAESLVRLLEGKGFVELDENLKITSDGEPEKKPEKTPFQQAWDVYTGKN